MTVTTVLRLENTMPNIWEGEFGCKMGILRYGTKLWDKCEEIRSVLLKQILS